MEEQIKALEIREAEIRKELASILNTMGTVEDKTCPTYLELEKEYAETTQEGSKVVKEILELEAAIKNGVEFVHEEQLSAEVVGKVATAQFLGWFDEVIITDNRTGEKVATFELTEKIANNKVEFAVDVFKMIENAIWAKKSLEQIGK